MFAAQWTRDHRHSVLAKIAFVCNITTLVVLRPRGGVGGGASPRVMAGLSKGLFSGREEYQVIGAHCNDNYVYVYVMQQAVEVLNTLQNSTRRHVGPKTHVEFYRTSTYLSRVGVEVEHSYS